MPNVTVKRSLIASFLNTGTVGVPIWSIIGPGVTTGKIAYNPKTLQEIYINVDTGTTLVESYMPNMPIEATVIAGDPVFNYIDVMRQARSVLSSAQTEVVNVWKYMTPALGYYEAERQTVSVQIDEFGGAGGEVAKIKFTINYQGVPAYGSFNPSTLTFVPDPVLAGLATLTIGALTFTPAFTPNWLWYAVATTVTPQNISSTAQTAGSTIVQKNGVTTIAQGGSAAFATGLNVVTIQVTNGTEVVTYEIDVTKS